MLNNKTIASLIKIGRWASGDAFDGTDCLAAVAGQDHINRIHWSEWDPQTSSMMTNDLVYLIKGLTVSEAHFRWCGGSVASTIWVFRELVRRGDADLISTLAKWVYLHRGNTYLPFGTTRYWSYEEFLHRSSAEYLLEKERVRKDREALKLASKQARIQRRAEAERKHREIGIQRSSLREKVLQQLSQMTICDRWHHIATVKTVTLDFYPLEWADVNDLDLQLLPPDTLVLLIDRLNVKCGRPWRALRQRAASLINA